MEEKKKISGKIVAALMAIALILSIVLILLSYFRGQRAEGASTFMLNTNYSGVYLTLESVETKQNAGGESYSVYHLCLHNETEREVVCPNTFSIIRYPTERALSREEATLPLAIESAESKLLPGQTLGLALSTEGFDTTIPGEYSVTYDVCVNRDDAALSLRFNVFGTQEKKIIALADRAMRSKYPLFPLGSFYVTLRERTDGGFRAVYSLKLGGKMTSEDFCVEVDASIKNASLDVYPKSTLYAAFIFRVNEEKIRAAELKLREAAREYQDLRSCSLHYDEDDRTLYLMTELIIEIECDPDAPGGCGIDHEHLFFREKVCSLP